MTAAFISWGLAAAFAIAGFVFDRSDRANGHWVLLVTLFFLSVAIGVSLMLLFAGFQ